MKSLSPEGVIALVSAVVPLTLLILGLSVPKSGVPRSAHSQAVGQVLTRPCRVGGPGCTMEMKPGPHGHLVLHDLMPTAISIAHLL
jgi:hypothetical protein